MAELLRELKFEEKLPNLRVFDTYGDVHYELCRERQHSNIKQVDGTCGKVVYYDDSVLYCKHIDQIERGEIRGMKFSTILLYDLSGSTAHELRQELAPYCPSGNIIVYSPETKDDANCEHENVPEASTRCEHKWRTTQGLFKAYKDCTKCGLKWEDYLPEANKEVSSGTTTITLPTAKEGRTLKIENKGDKPIYVVGENLESGAVHEETETLTFKNGSTVTLSSIPLEANWHTNLELGLTEQDEKIATLEAKLAELEKKLDIINKENKFLHERIKITETLKNTEEPFGVQSVLRPRGRLDSQ